MCEETMATATGHRPTVQTLLWGELRAHLFTEGSKWSAFSSTQFWVSAKGSNSKSLWTDRQTGKYFLYLGWEEGLEEGMWKKEGGFEGEDEAGELEGGEREEGV